MTVLSYGAQLTYNTYDNIGASNTTAPGLVGSQCDPVMIWSGGDIWFTAQVPASGWMQVNIVPTGTTRPDYGVAVYSGYPIVPTSGMFFPPTSTMSNPNPACIRCFIVADTVPDAYSALTPLHIYPWDNVAGQTVWIRLWTLSDPNYPGTGTSPYYTYQGNIDICAFENDNSHYPTVENQGSGMSVTQIVQQIFANNQCDSVFNVSYSGTPQSLGIFSNGDSIGFTHGAVLATGEAVRIRGNGQNDRSNDIFNTNTLPELNALCGGSGGGDCAILEFDYIPNADTIWFRYIFGSEEYNEFVNEGVNDVFGFFISGTNPSGGSYTNENIALIPGTNLPVCINNLNNGKHRFVTVGTDFLPPFGTGASLCNNCQYYRDNVMGEYPLTWDGLTVPMVARLDVVPCQTYHVKLAIQDVSDRFYDSGILFEAKSFIASGTGNVQHFDMQGNQTNQAMEGCSYYFIVSRPDTLNMNDSVPVPLNITGTALMGDDYSNISQTVWMAPGQMYDTIYYDAYLDGIIENNEYILLTLTGGCLCNPSTVTDTIWFIENIPPNPVISPDTTICSGEQAVISVLIDPQINPSTVSYHWSVTGSGNTIIVNPSSQTTYYVTVSIPCQNDTVLSSTVFIDPGIPAEINISDDSLCIGQNTIIEFGGTQTSGIQFDWSFDNGQPSSLSGPGPHNVYWNAAGTYNITLQVDALCLSDSTINITVLDPPVFSISSDSCSCYNICDGSLTASPSNYIYQWSNNQTGSQISGLCSGNYQVTVTDSQACTSFGSESVAQPTLLFVTITDSSNPSCFGYLDGSIEASASGGTPGYSWLWNSGGTSSTETGLSAGTYTVTATDSHNCTAETTITITEPAGITANIEPEHLLCYGDSDGEADLTVSGGTIPYQYLWNTGATSEDLNNLVAGAYSVTVTDANLCSIIETVTISGVNAPIEITLTTDDVNCYNGSDGSITSSVIGGVPGYTYFWSTHQNSANLYNLEAGTYSLTVTDQNQCMEVAMAQVNEPDQLYVELPPDFYMCLNPEEIILASATGGTPPYQYSWPGGETSADITVSPNQNTDYTVVVTDAHGCTNQDEITVMIYPDLELQLFVSSDSVCPGDPVLISASYFGGSGAPYQLFLDNQHINMPVTVYPGENNTYQVSILDQCGNTVNDHISIYSFQEPPLSFNSDVLNGCAPLRVQFNESGNCQGCSYVWDFNDDFHGNLSYAHSPAHVFEEAGVYDITCTVKDKNGCTTSQVFSQMITVYPVPDAEFTADPEMVSIIQPMISFFNSTTGAVDYFWHFGDGDSSLQTHPYHTYQDIGTFNVELIAVSAKGCRDTVYYTIQVKDEYTFYAPTAFSPDYDGINDVFRVYGHGIDQDKFLLKIYDRWGEPIFESTDMEKGWDGCAKNGRDIVKIGSYTWIAIVYDMNGIQHEETGSVTVIR
ncbi:MAG: choice-of-anchor L domain-containing protein [Bacteroidota bacterium]